MRVPPDRLVQAVKAAGVAGAGGAGFPAWRKLDCAGRVGTVILNGAECEPLLYSDLECMIHCPEAIVETAGVLRETLGAAEAVVAFKRKRAGYLSRLAALAGARPGVRIVELEDVYPSGDEHVLTYLVTGRVPPQGGIPLDVGVVVQNVQTAVHIHDALQGKPVTHRFVTMGGAVRRPVCVEAPLGTPLEELLDLAGGPSCDNPVFLAGGVMMGRPVPLSASVGKTTSGFLVLPADNPAVREATGDGRRDLKIAASVCDQCYTCTALCPRRLLGHAIEPHLLMRRAAAVLEQPEDRDHIAVYCCECGVCALLACPLRITPRRLIGEMKKVISRDSVRKEHRTADPAFLAKAFPMKQLMMRLALTRYEGVPRFLGPLRGTGRLRLELCEFGGGVLQPAVRTGERVHVGERIAAGKWTDLHASADGTVEVLPEAILLSP